MPDRNKVSRCFLSVASFMFLLALAVSVTPVADLDGIAHQSTTAVSDTKRGGMLLAGTPHSPIAIDGDANFSDTALLEGWPGDGSPENPYIIENYNIDVNYADVSCIEIRDIASTYFIIRGCTVTGAIVGRIGYPSQAGIYLYNVNYGKKTYITRICDNTCYGNYFGIRLEDCYAILVADNTCSENSFEGIAVNGESSSRNLVTGNLCVGNENGIGIGANTFENMVLNNRVYNNQDAGIHFWLGFDTVVQENDCQGNIEYGICIRGESTGNQILDNLCVANNVGIFLYTADYNVIANNTCNSNDIGISLDESDSNTVTDNTCSRNFEDGIFLGHSDSSTVDNNNCNSNDIGISLDESDSNTVTDNTCSRNFEDGIFLGHSDSSTVDNNNCNSNEIGIALFFSRNNTVVNSFCSNNRIGISLDVSDANTVDNNNCNSNEIGISLDESDSNTVTDNTCFRNFEDGIFLGHSDSNTVMYNTCNNNRIGIYLSGSGANIVAYNICSGNTEHDILEVIVVIDPVVLLLVGVVAITLLGARWGWAKLSRAGISETWIDGSAIPPEDELWIEKEQTDYWWEKANTAHKRLFCPRCGATYLYGPQHAIRTGVVRCQNCDQEFLSGATG
ncbi:MAG: NosD domain-containing protein [Promethearchaeota archaeon]